MKPLQVARDKGLITWDESADLVVPTVRGFDFLSDLQGLFLPS